VVVNRDGTGRGGEAEDQSQSFLKKKEEELRQRRERERQTAEARSKQPADSTFSVSPPSSAVPVAKVAAPATPKLEFIAVTTVTSPTAEVSTSLISPPERRAVTGVEATSPPLATTTPYLPVRPLPGAVDSIPEFYFPFGSPASVEMDETTVKKVREEFEKFDNGKAAKTALGPVLKVRL